MVQQPLGRHGEQSSAVAKEQEDRNKALRASMKEGVAIIDRMLVENRILLVLIERF